MENKIDIYLVAFFIAFVLFIAGIMMLFAQFKNRQKLAAKEKQMLEQQHTQQLLQARFDMQQQTMEQIGREIHDNVGQKLTLASLYTQQLDFDNKYPELAERINSIGATINESLHDLRSLSKTLTSATIEEGSLKSLLENEIARLPPGSFEMEQQLKDMPIGQTEIKTMLVRITQEFFQNTIKYAQATKIIVRLSEAPDGLHFLLKDNGRGFDDTQQSEGIGLQNMKARISSVGGTLAMHSRPGEGTELEVFIPKEKL